jgi:predicted site-specific integrase-resolvase
MDGRWITIQEFTELHQISITTARRWIRYGKVESEKRRGIWYLKSYKKQNPMYGRTKLQLLDENLALKKEVQRLQKIVRKLYQKVVFDD